MLLRSWSRAVGGKQASSFRGKEAKVKRSHGGEVSKFAQVAGCGALEVNIRHADSSGYSVDVGPFTKSRKIEDGMFR